ncbi:MAG: HEPN domain-containing protein [Deltaproteobacteria bacterium]|nr:HEPN domain-containing protein [Deltaproteobacteria bacterium]
MGSKVAFEKCLKKNGLKIASAATQLVGKEIEAAATDLQEAKAGLARQSYKWSTIQSYYAMFHLARALLYAKGYREKSHYCLRVALEALYVEDGDLPVHIVDAFQVAKELRENADYEAHFSESGARKLVSAAEDFFLYVARSERTP